MNWSKYASTDKASNMDLDKKQNMYDPLIVFRKYFKTVTLTLKNSMGNNTSSEKTQHVKIKISILTYNDLSLASFLWEIGKQCRHRPNAAERGIWSASPLFAYIMVYWNLNRNEKYHPQPKTRNEVVQSISVGNSIALNGLRYTHVIVNTIFLPRLKLEIELDSLLLLLYKIYQISAWPGSLSGPENF